MTDRMTEVQLRGGAAVMRLKQNARNKTLAYGSLPNEPLAGLSWLALARVSGLNLGLNPG